MDIQMQKAVTALAENDPLIAAIIDKHGQLPNFSPHTEYYRELVESIVGQQLSVKAAASIRKRFIGLFNDSFPSPEAITNKTIEELRMAGLSRAKAAYIQDLATHIINGTLDLTTLDRLTNEEIIERLTAVKGIGIWTAHMFLMFCMGRLDILPVGDLGIRNGIQKLYNLENIPTPTKIEQIAQAHHWHPYESVAAWYIWKSLDNMPNDA